MNHIPFSDFSPPVISSYTGNEPAFTLVYRALQDLFKCCTQYASKFGKLSSGHRTGKGQFSFQSQRRAMPKNVQVQFSSVQFSCSLLPTPWTEACKASLSITNFRSLLKLMSTKSMMRSNHLILCHPLLLLPPILASNRVFSNESVLHIRWPKYWTFSFSISPSNEYSGLISFRIDCFDLLAVQGTLKKSLLQHHNSKASVLWHSALFIVRLSHLYRTEKNHGFD